MSQLELSDLVPTSHPVGTPLPPGDPGCSDANDRREGRDSAVSSSGPRADAATARKGGESGTLETPGGDSPDVGALGGARDSSTSSVRGSERCAPRSGGTEGIETSRSPSESAGLSSVTRGAQVIYDHLDDQLRSTKAIADEAGFIVKGAARHLAALAEAGLAIEQTGGWMRA